MNEFETVLKVLGAKIKELETTIFCKELEIKKLKEELGGNKNE